MHRRSFKILITAGAALTAIASGQASAQTTQDKDPNTAVVEPTPLFGLKGGVNFLTDYRLRGASLSDNKPVVQGNVELGVPIGESFNVFGGIWASSLDKDAGAGAMETDFYAGVGGKIGAATWRARYLRLVFHDARNIDFDQFEGGVVVPLGPVGVGAGIVHDEYNSGGQSTYVYGSASYAVPDTGFAVKGLVGYEDGSNWNDKVNWSAGATYTYNRLTFGATYTDTNRFSANTRGDNRAGSTVVFSVGTSF